MGRPLDSDYTDISNEMSLLDKSKIVLGVLPSPIIFAWALLKSPFTSYGRAHSWKRILADQILRRIVLSLNRKQSLWLLGTSEAIYRDYIKSQNLPPFIEEIGDGAQLLWIDEKRTDRVLLYLHGGAMVLPMPSFSPGLYHHLQRSLGQRGKPTGLAILDYTLVPEKRYPAQLRQTILAIQSLIDAGAKPENIQLVGDSAGALLMHGVFSHILHPLEGMPDLKLSGPIGGAYMLSPWSRIANTDNALYKYNPSADFLTGSVMENWGRWVLEGVPPKVMPYLEANSVPEGWMKGSDKAVKRIFISAGTHECLRNEIIIYAEMMQKYHSNVKFVLHQNAVHNDLYADIMAGEKVGELTPLVVDFLYEGFEKQ